MKIRNIRNLGISQKLLKEGEANKGIDLLLPILKRFFKFLHIPYFDDCCPEENTELPTSYNQGEATLNFYNPETKVLELIPISGGGGSAARFGIEDNTGVQDRSVDIGNNSFTIENVYDLKIGEESSDYNPSAAIKKFSTNQKNNVLILSQGNYDYEKLYGIKNSVESSTLDVSGPNPFFRKVGYNWTKLEALDSLGKSRSFSDYVDIGYDLPTATFDNTSSHSENFNSEKASANLTLTNGKQHSTYKIDMYSEDAGSGYGISKAFFSSVNGIPSYYFSTDNGNDGIYVNNPNPLLGSGYLNFTLPVSVNGIPADSAGNITVPDPRPYKVYTALLTQTGTNAPVATVLENTLGFIPTFSYNVDGDYSIIGVFPNNKTHILLNANNDEIFILRSYKNLGETTIGLQSIRIQIDGTNIIENGALSFDGASIEIRVYN